MDCPFNASNIPRQLPFSEQLRTSIENAQTEDALPPGKFTRGFSDNLILTFPLAA